MSPQAEREAVTASFVRQLRAEEAVRMRPEMEGWAGLPAILWPSYIEFTEALERWESDPSDTHLWGVRSAYCDVLRSWDWATEEHRHSSENGP